MEIKFDTYRTSKQKLEYYDILEEARMAIEESKKVIEESRKAREKNLQTMYKHRKTIAKVLSFIPISSNLYDSSSIFICSHLI